MVVPAPTALVPIGLAAARPAYLECAAKLRTHGHTLKALESALRTRLADFKRMDRQVEESVRCCFFFSCFLSFFFRIFLEFF